MLNIKILIEIHFETYKWASYILYQRLSACLF